LNNWDGDLEQTKAINFDELENKRGNGNTQVLDVRKATEYQNGHVPNSIHIAHTRLANHLDELPQDKTLLVHCASGQRASYAAGLLARKGFDIEWVDDAFSNWKESHS
jgi:hydroxyacylglutathione hydrolase